MFFLFQYILQLKGSSFILKGGRERKLGIFNYFFVLWPTSTQLRRVRERRGALTSAFPPPPLPLSPSSFPPSLSLSLSLSPSFPPSSPSPSLSLSLSLSHHESTPLLSP